MTLLEKPDVLIYDVNTNLTKKIKKIIYNSLCGVAKISTNPLEECNGNTFELTNEEITINVKKMENLQKKL